MKQPLRGFDTGPGNALLDAWCAAHTGRRFDEDGTWASGGRVVSGLLSALLALDDMLRGLVEDEQSIDTIAARGHDRAAVERMLAVGRSPTSA